ncbi:serine/threonine-protein kinase [Thermoactinospora rubra]|uniref:serine/threonine-protein kinase n=1 Tax=Thermoactinospora rubra TaxID=1088767 RepID=UPI000A0F442A|nr:serine/threonine-protein kinase [Thermoactinospora rubra]
MVFPLEPDDPPQLGDYRLAGRLGEGGQGVVYLGFDPVGERVAVKLLSSGDRETRARLGRELQALESIASFCTARVLAVSTDGPRPWVASEYVDGPSLATRVFERGPLHGGELERLAVGTATALAAIHAAGIVHRDFKPGNVLLGPDGPRVVDFGIARAEGAATMTSGLIGTPAYLAPEQINGSPASAASDVFAWGATMLYAATGSSPFGADTVPAVMHRVLYSEPDLSPLPPRLRGIIGAALSKDPARRPSAKELMVALVNPQAAAPMATPVAASPGTIPPHPVSHPGGHPRGAPPHGGHGAWTDPGSRANSTVPPPRPPSRRAPIVATAVAVALAATAAGVVLWLNRDPSPGDDQPTRTVAASSPAAGRQPTETPPSPSPSPSEDESSQPADAGQQGDLKIPAAFAGTWKGTADSRAIDGKTFEDEPVTITLAAGRSKGTWESPGEDAGCSKGELVLTGYSTSALIFELTGLGGTCVGFDLLGTNPTIKLTRKNAITLDYQANFVMGQSKGILKKSS